MASSREMLVSVSGQRYSTHTDGKIDVGGGRIYAGGDGVARKSHLLGLYSFVVKKNQRAPLYAILLCLFSTKRGAPLTNGSGRRLRARARAAPPAGPCNVRPFGVQPCTLSRDSSTGFSGNVAKKRAPAKRPAIARGYKLLRRELLGLRI